MSSWIKMIADNEASPELLETMKLARTPHGTIDNVMRVHSLRPSSMHGHVILYRATLLDESNELPTWLQEIIGSYVSILNKCEYSLANHWLNARHLIADETRAETINIALKSKRPEDAFEGVELALLKYAEKLTLTPTKMEEADIKNLRSAGCDDGVILEANQIVGYFNYVNRLINGLGVTTDGDIVGYYSKAETNKN